MKEDLEKQLHEQYAINNNAHTSSFISFVVALFALFGTLGYVYAYSSPYTYRYHDIFSIDIYFLLSIVVSVVLLFLTHICVHIGWSQRRDQIVITKIRKDIGMELSYNDPKTKDRKSFLPDYYNVFYRLFVVSQIGVFSLTILKTQNNCNDMHGICTCLAVIAFTMHVVCVIVCWCLKYCFFYKKYKTFVSSLNSTNKETEADNVGKNATTLNK